MFEIKQIKYEFDISINNIPKQLNNKIAPIFNKIPGYRKPFGLIKISTFKINKKNIIMNKIDLFLFFSIFPNRLIEPRKRPVTPIGSISTIWPKVCLIS